MLRFPGCLDHPWLSLKGKAQGRACNSKKSNFFSVSLQQGDVPYSEFPVPVPPVRFGKGTGILAGQLSRKLSSSPPNQPKQECWRSCLLSSEEQTVLSLAFLSEGSKFQGHHRKTSTKKLCVGETHQAEMATGHKQGALEDLPAPSWHSGMCLEGTRRGFAAPQNT